MCARDTYKLPKQKRECESDAFVDGCVGLPHLPHWQTRCQHNASDVDAAGRDIECNPVDTRASTSSGPNTRDRSALENEREKDGQAADQNDASDDSDTAAESAFEGDSPIEGQNCDLGYGYSERPEHHEDIQAPIMY